MSQYPPNYPPQMPQSHDLQAGYPPQPGYPPGQPAYPPAGYTSYPVQPGYGVAQPSHRGKAGLWIVIVVVAVLLLGGGGATYFVIQGQSSPMATLQRYCDGEKNRNAQEVYDTFGTSMQQKTSLSTLQQGFASSDTNSNDACKFGNYPGEILTIILVIRYTWSR